MNDPQPFAFMQTHEKDLLHQLTNRIASIQDTSGIFVTDAASLNEAAICLSQYRSIEKQTEKIRKLITEPLNGLVKEANAYFKNLLLQTTIPSELKRLDSEIITFNNAEKAKVEAIRRAEQKYNEEVALNNAIAAGKDQPAIIVETIIPQYKVSNQTAYISTTTIKKWRVTEITLVPRALFSLDELAINAVRRASKAEDKSSIPGIEFYTEDSVRSK